MVTANSTQLWRGYWAIDRQTWKKPIGGVKAIGYNRQADMAKPIGYRQADMAEPIGGVQAIGYRQADVKAHVVILFSNTLNQILL